MEEDKNTNSFISVRDDSKIQINLIDKYVKVELIKNRSFEGFLNCYDPVSNSIVISVIQDGGFKTAVIPGHAILNIMEHTPPTDILPHKRKLDTTAPEDPTRKNKLLEWLKCNLLPVTEVDNRIIFGNVSILPPYNVSSICTDSPMIAMQIRKLIENMPDDAAKE